MRFNLTLVLLCTVMSLSSTRALLGQTTDDWSFGTLPVNGTISGHPGETIGWGYTLHNASQTNWLFAFDLEASGPFDHATASSAPFDFPVVSPGASVSVPYDGNGGLADLTWDADAPDGFVDAGIFTLTSYWYDGDPFNGGNLIDSAGAHDAPYSAIVTAPSEVPEPGLFAFLACMAGGLSVLYHRRRANHAKAG